MKKNVLVVGGSGFIGGAIAKALEEEGCKVFSTSRSGKNGFINLDEIKSGKNGFIRLDVTIPATIEITRLIMNEEAVKLDAIVYAVGDCPKGGFVKELGKRLTDINPAELQKNLDLHVTGLLNVVQGLLPCLKDGGHIIVMSSSVTRLNNEPAFRVPRFLTIGHYAAAISAKDALIGWLRKDQQIVERDIKIDRLAPPAVDSPFHEGTPKEFSPPALLPVAKIVEAVMYALTFDKEQLDVDFTCKFPNQ